MRKVSENHSFHLDEATSALSVFPACIVKGPITTIAALVLAMTLFACTGAVADPDQTSNKFESEPNTNIIVPDEISELNASELELRLGRLLEVNRGTGNDRLGAQDVEPTAISEDPTLQEILDLLNSGPQISGAGEIVISISPQAVRRLTAPALIIKTPPQFGTATVISPNQILYTPGNTSGQNDAFEYELFDGTESVIAMAIEMNGTG